MLYLEYQTETKQVVDIHEKKPSVAPGYDYATSEHFKKGDEFEWTIWIDNVDKEKKLQTYSAIRNNPNAKRLLKENEELKTRLKMTEDTLLDLLLGGM